MELQTFVREFAEALMAVDSKAPIARNARTGASFQPGIGPHSESETVRLVLAELSAQLPETYATHTPAPYPASPRQKVDALVRPRGDTPWALEFKLLRLLGDNGGENDNMLMHILSPYPKHRSAFTDCQKLSASAFDARKAIVIIGYEAPALPIELAVETFEGLARQHFTLSARYTSGFKDLIHPVHKSAQIFAWELLKSYEVTHHPPDSF